eukprot:1408448-Pyramimonas_sp.AAC.1
MERHRKRKNGNSQVQQLSESAKKLVYTAPAGVHELCPSGFDIWAEWWRSLLPSTRSRWVS